jgi:peptide/nickel transport system substrate-binding protein
MKRDVSKIALTLAAAGALAFAFAGAAANAAPKKGGILKYIIPSNPPSADGHRETTFGTIHPFAQFYSVLIRVNPDNPGSPTDFKCDLCLGDVPKPTNGGKKYTFKIRKGVTWHSLPASVKTSPEHKAMTKLVGGKELNAHDIAASFNKIVNPPKGVGSPRKA